MCSQCGLASGPCPCPAPAQRLYAYDECGKAFVRCSGLHRHQKTQWSATAEAWLRRGGLPGWGAYPAGTVARGCLWLGEALGMHLTRAGLWPVLSPGGALARAQGRKVGRGPGVRQGLQPALQPGPAGRTRISARPSRALRPGAARARVGERPYGCPECGKTFRGCSELRQPQHLHSGYICRDCGKALGRNSASGATGARTSVSGPIRAPSAATLSASRASEAAPCCALAQGGP